MTWQWTPSTIPLILTATISTAVAFYVFVRRRHRPASRVGLVLLLASGVWMLGSALEAASLSLPDRIFWEKVQFVGICIIPTAWLVYMFRYTDHDEWLTPRTWVLLSVVPLITFLLVITNERHGLIWSHAWLDTSGRFVVKQVTYGVGLWAYIVYAYMLLLIGVLLLFQALVRSTHLYRWQASALLVAVTTPWLLSATEHILGWTLLGDVKLTPLALGVTIPVIAWGLYRLRLRDIVPVARDAVLESMADALLVLDTSNRIIDLNPAAQGLIDRTRPQVLGRTLKQVWSGWSGWPEPSKYGAETSQEVVLGQGDERRSYDMRISPLTDWRGKLVSRVIVLRDITEHRRAEAQIAASLKEKEVILESSTALTSSLDLGQVLMILADHLLRLSGFHICAVSEWDRETEQICVLAEHSRAIWPPDGGEAYLLSEYPTTRQVLTTGQPQVVRVDMDDPESTWMQEMGLKALLMLPLRAGEETIGLVEVGSPILTSTFDESTILRCQKILREAAAQLKSPLWANPGSALLALARRLAELGDSLSCVISDWCRPEEAVRTAIEYADLTWPLGQGTRYRLAEWPSSMRAVEDNLSTVVRLCDLNSDSADREELEMWGARTLVVLPLTVKRESVGIVELYNVAEERAVSDEELNLWQAVMGQAAIAIENARLHAETQRRLSEQTALRQAGAILSSSLDLETVLDRIAEQMGQAIDATSTYICTYDAEEKVAHVLAEWLSSHACRREQASDLGVGYQEEDVKFLAKMQSGQHDVSHIDDPNLPEIDHDHMQQYGAQSILYIPLQVKDRLVGYAELWESRQRREFMPEEIALAHDMARQAAVALENARLYEQAQQEIMERRRAEEALERYAAELERSNQELQQFAYVASHDLQEPLRMVTSYVQLLERRYKDQLDADADDFIAFAVDGAVRMRQLIQGLLAYSRVGTQGQPFEPTECETVLTQVLGNLRVAIEESGAVVTHDPLPTVTADPTQLVQLFQNLLANAIKFRAEQPPAIHVGAERQGAGWRVWVRDNGIGIEPEYLERVFLIFQRLHTRDEYPGTGIGLAICKRIVERHGGRIWVESEPGRGAAFHFILPERR